jgi:hypothetical protein
LFRPAFAAAASSGESAASAARTDERSSCRRWRPAFAAEASPGEVAWRAARIDDRSFCRRWRAAFAAEASSGLGAGLAYQGEAFNEMFVEKRMITYEVASRAARMLLTSAESVWGVGSASVRPTRTRDITASFMM